MSEKIAKFRLVDFLISKSSIDLGSLTHKDALSVEFAHSKVIDQEGKKLQYSLEVEIWNETKTIRYINVLCIGFFEFDSDLTTQDKEAFMNSNAPAILYPYIRAYISSLTALSGIKPIILPTINIAGTLANQEK